VPLSPGRSGTPGGVGSVMACSRLLRADEDAAAGDRRPLACRRSVSWYGLRLNIIQESGDAASALSQV